MDEKPSTLEPFSEEELRRLKERNPQEQPLTPHEWERLRKQRQRPEYSET